MGWAVAAGGGGGCDKGIGRYEIKYSNDDSVQMRNGWALQSDAQNMIKAAARRVRKYLVRNKSRNCFAKMMKHGLIEIACACVLKCVRKRESERVRGKCGWTDGRRASRVYLRKQELP